MTRTFTAQQRRHKTIKWQMAHAAHSATRAVINNNDGNGSQGSNSGERNSAPTGPRSINTHGGNGSGGSGSGERNSAPTGPRSTNNHGGNGPGGVRLW